MEGAATTVYAQGGRGNARLAAWEGERTVTFTMEDALISTLGLAILTGAGVMDAESKPVIQHVTETVSVKEDGITLANVPHIDGEHYIYVMKLDSNGNVESEPYIYVGTPGEKKISILSSDDYTVDAEARCR